ncbi:hypothetical protein [Kosakonia sp. Marseille-Q7440]
MSTHFLACDKVRKYKIATLENYNGESIIQLPTEALASDQTQTPIMKDYFVVRHIFGGATYLIATRDGVFPDNPQDAIARHQIPPYQY